MSTVALVINTSPYNLITNNIQINIYAQSDPSAILYSLNYAAPHLARVWSFPGLTRANYLFRIFEMSGSTVIQQLGEDMYVVPDSLGGVNYRGTEQIQAGVTTGLNVGANTFTFDGTSGTEDWRGWDISSIERIGLGTMKKGVDYSWNITTGVFILLNAGDAFGPNEWFTVNFVLQVAPIPDSVPSFNLFSSSQRITSNYLVSAGTDFGGVLILDPTGNYMEVTLPDITTVPALKLLTLEMRRSAGIKCTKIKTTGSDTIDWLQGSRNSIYILPQETIAFYKFIDTLTSTYMWRVYQPCGNFLRVGEQVSDDNSSANVFNKILLDGSSYDASQFARLYNDYILNLPGSQVVNYDAWSTSPNNLKFSLANSSNPSYVNQFHVPNRLNMYERITDGTRLPGDYQAPQVGAFNPTVSLPIGDSFTGPAGGGWAGIPGRGQNSPTTNTFIQAFNTGLENRVANIAIRKYLLT